MALLLAVLIAVVLIAAASALLAVQLQSRRSSTSASNRELAEAAARTGLSRIEALINNGCGDGRTAIGCNAYRYLWEVPSGTNTSNWNAAGTAAGGPTIRPLLNQPCSFTPLNATDLATLKGSTIEGGRQDGGGAITSRYNLRSYSRSGSNGVLSVEGLTERTVNGNTVIVARNLITKTFEISTLGVSRQNPSDSSLGWPQIAGLSMELGESTASVTRTAGGIQWVLDETSTNRRRFEGTDACGAYLFNMVNLDTRSQIGGIGVWPTVGQPMPGNGWFDTNVFADKNTYGAERVWQCDDNGCNYPDASVSGTVIRLPESKLCVGNSALQPCRITIKSIVLASRRLLVEVQSRPVIVQLSYGGFINLSGSGQLCPVNSGSTSCLSSSERLVIYSGSADDTSSSCSTAPTFGQTYVSVSGGSLPSALGVLPAATFRATSAVSLNGVVWADRICAPYGLSMVYGDGGSGVLARASSLYAFSTNAAVGRSWIGSRGTTIDPLQSWQ